MPLSGIPGQFTACGCNAPVIVEAAGRVLEGTDRKIRNLTGTGLSTLCREYISRDIPVILWATIQMQAWTNTITWTDEVKGDTVTFYTAEHCLVLMGFDEENYYFSDPPRNRRSQPMTGPAWRRPTKSWENRRQRWCRRTGNCSGNKEPPRKMKFLAEWFLCEYNKRKKVQGSIFRKGGAAWSSTMY